MARKTTQVTITAEGRDKGKVFGITEMPAEQAESWGMRLLITLASSGVQIPDNLMELGMMGVAAMGIQALAGLKWQEAKPLLDEMLGCISLHPDPRHPEAVRAMVAGDIEEVATLVRLREEVITLHTGFSIAAYMSALREAASIDLERQRAAEASSGSNTQTSQGRLARSSRTASRRSKTSKRSTA